VKFPRLFNEAVQAAEKGWSYPMRLIVLLAAAAATFVNIAGPARAEGLRVEAHGGWDRVQGGGHRDGVLYGAGIGYDVALAPKVVLGVEADIDGSTAKDCDGAGATHYCAKAGRDLSAVGRIGYKLSDMSLVYALGGYTNARARVTGALKGAENLDGLRLGLGYEQMLSTVVYVKGEYRYSNYEGGAERHQLLAGVGVKF
jgi:outer membrane immunogenic protein